MVKIAFRTQTFQQWRALRTKEMLEIFVMVALKQVKVNITEISVSITQKQVKDKNFFGVNVTNVGYTYTQRINANENSCFKREEAKRMI